MTHVTRRLTAKNRDQLRNPTLGNRVWDTFTFYLLTALQQCVYSVADSEDAPLSVQRAQPTWAATTLAMTSRETGFAEDTREQILQHNPTITPTHSLPDFDSTWQNWRNDSHTHITYQLFYHSLINKLSTYVSHILMFNMLILAS